MHAMKLRLATFLLSAAAASAFAAAPAPAAPAADAAGNWVYVFPRADGEVEFVLRAELVSHAQAQLAQNETPDKIQVGTGN